MGVPSSQEAILICEEREMSFLKLNGGTGAVLVALALLVATCRPALADTTTLVCPSGSPHDASPTTIDLDEAKGLVTIHYGAVHNPGGSPDPIPGKTEGPFTAKFDPKEIVFEVLATGRADTTYTLNRLTGALEFEYAGQHG